MTKAVELLKLPVEKVPEDFRVKTYFDLAAHPFRHAAFFRDAEVTNVASAVRHIGRYTSSWLAGTLPMLSAERGVCVTSSPVAPPAFSHGCYRIALEQGALFTPSGVIGLDDDSTPRTVYVAAGARVFGDIHLERGDVYIGAGTRVERGAVVQGPSIIGENNDIRMGAYIRGDVILGDHGVFRGEMRNCVVLDRAGFPHPCYLGDSLCGFASHFGNQATAANFGLFEGMRPQEAQRNVHVEAGGTLYDLGSPKFGIVLGDFSQVGCNSVSDPGTFLKPRTIVYPLTRINSGFYGPRVLLKNKPMEHGVVEIASLEWEE